MFLHHPADPPAARPPQRPVQQGERIARLRRLLAQDAPSPLKRELVARSLLLNGALPPKR